jgi:hypothetical protein
MVRGFLNVGISQRYCRFGLPSTSWKALTGTVPHYARKEKIAIK